MLKMTLFYTLCIIHVVVWLFVMFAFLNNQYARINLYYIIPLIYILHTLPFHILIQSKKHLVGENMEEEQDKFLSNIHLKWATDLQKYLEEKCFFSPLSAQGMMIFGALSSSYVLLCEES